MVTNKLIKENNKNKINSNYNRLAGLNSQGSFKIPYRRKEDFEYATAIDFNLLGKLTKRTINTLSVYTLSEDACAFDNIFPDYVTGENQYCYLVMKGDNVYLVNNEGFKYCRYIVQLFNY
jgi:hypothetical protein